MQGITVTYNQQGRLIGIKGVTTPRLLKQQMMMLKEQLGDNDEHTT